MALKNASGETARAGEFRTQRGYEEEYARGGELTAAMEDYLEMICRIAKREGEVRVRELASRLHVKPSSASKMASHLDALGYVTAERYGMIRPTEAGRGVGDYLLYRHETVERFLRVLNGSRDETEQAEMIEHFLDRRTVANLERASKILRSSGGNPT